MRRLIVILAALLMVCSAAEARQERSQAAKTDFKHLHPCPVTGSSKGACHGWVIDHIKPLDCGGADAPGNMQWQTRDDAKAKDKWERNGPECKHRTHGDGGSEE